MLATLIQKELRAIILSPKFAGAFAVCSILILLSVFTGIREYQGALKQYETAQQLQNETMRQATSWGHLSTRAFRKPDPMQIFSSGLTYDIGRWSSISEDRVVQLRNSPYSDDPVFAVFRFIDFAFIVQFVLSLLAILFTYDAVCGEREGGTLRLVFSNSVPRAKYLIAKCIGAMLGLVLPVCIPILLSLLFVMAFGISLTTIHWIKISTMVGFSLMLFTFFIVLGVFVSALTRRSSVSFLASLVLWIAFVMIIPRAGVMAAGSLVHVPRVAEIEGQRAGFSKNKWDEYYKSMTDGMVYYESIPEDNEEERDERLWAIMESQDSLRKVVETEIEEYGLRLHEDLRQRKAAQEELAFTISRFSPASSYLLATMSLASTDIRSKHAWEDAMAAYRGEFNTFVEHKIKETGDEGSFSISMSMGGDGCGDEPDISISNTRNSAGLDIAGVPEFRAPEQTTAEVVQPVVADFGLLSLSIILSFAGAFVAFLRYDVR